MIAPWPDPEVVRAAQAAFARSDAEAALHGLGALRPIGPDLPLHTAVVLVTAAARAGHATPVAARLLAATVAGHDVGAVALSDGGACPFVEGTAQIVVITPQGARLADAARHLPATDPLQAQPWAVPAPGPASDLRDLRPLAWVLLAAEALGAAEAAFAAGTDHLCTRRQFGRLLGSFQTLRHRAAADWVRLEDMRAAVALAAQLHEAGGADFLHAARVAKAIASDHAPLVVENAIHAMGAMGFTWVAGLGEPLARTRHIAALFGTADAHYHALGTSLAAEISTRETAHGHD